LTAFGPLVAMTVLTVLVTYVDLGPANLFVAMGIAIFKATIVVLYFMHARWSSRLTHVTILSALVFLGILFSFTLADYFTRGLIGVAGRASGTILCRCMRVTRSGFYAWVRRGLSARAQRDLVLRTTLRAFHAASYDRYGRPRLWKDLKEDGETVSEKRVRRLMREEGLQGKIPKPFKQTTNSQHHDPFAANLLDRDFTAAAPNQRWVGDTTEFVIGGGGAKLYLARRGFAWH